MAAKFTHILCPVDLDGSGATVLEMAAKVAHRETRVHVLHVVALPLPGEGTSVLIEAYRQRAEVARVAIAELVSKHMAGVNVEQQVEIGDPANIVIGTAKALSADLLVMATHGRKGISRFLLGSVAEVVVRNVDCPVLLAKHQPADRKTVAFWMSAHLLIIAPDEPLTAACTKMQGHRVRGLPVVEGEELIGIITDRDIRNHLLSLDSTTVRQAMTLSPVTVTPSTSVKEAAQLLDRHKVGALPVLADGHLVGIVSTSDLLKALIEW